MRTFVYASLALFCFTYQSCTNKLNTNIGQKIVAKEQVMIPVDRPMQIKRRINDRIPSLSEKGQLFYVNTETDTILMGEKGTRIFLSAHCLVDKKGASVKGPVQLELIELYSKKDMVLSNKPTVSNGKLLESNGEIFLNARSEGKNLLIGCEEGLKIALATPSDESMKMWLGGIDKSGNINWQEDSSIVPVAADPERNYETYDGDGEGNGMQIYDNTVNNYLFTTAKFGWINCDRFYEDSTAKVDMYVQLKNPFPKEYQTYVYVLFPEINSVLPVYSADGSTYILENIPSGKNMHIVCVSATETKTFFDMKKSRVEEGVRETMELQPMAKKEIEQKLEGL
jgi:hypothetical protein